MAVLSTVTTKQSSLKALLTEGKVPVSTKLQYWIWELGSEVPWESVSEDTEIH